MRDGSVYRMGLDSRGRDVSDNEKKDGRTEKQADCGCARQRRPRLPDHSVA